jgi:hypothetical protein
MEFEIPESLELEHEELHRQLVDAMKEGGKVGEAAKAVANVLHPHFEKEEEYAAFRFIIYFSKTNPN